MGETHALNCSPVMFRLRWSEVLYTGLHTRNKRMHTCNKRIHNYNKRIHNYNKRIHNYNKRIVSYIITTDEISTYAY